MGLRGFLLLALHFWKHVLLKVTFLHRPGGSARFVANYRPDRLLPVDPATRADLAGWHACVACGICDAVYPHPGVSLMSIVVSGVRDFSMMPDIAEDAARLDDLERLREAAEACPADVPIPDVVAYVATAPERLRQAA